MKVLLTGNKGYIGSVLAETLLSRGHIPTGYDIGFYSDCILYPLTYSIKEIRKDLRDVTVEDCQGYDAVIHLAALSNDPLGELDPSLTEEINYRAAVQLARCAKEARVKRFIYGSSQSMYGIADPSSEVEEDASEKNPLTAYARTKWDAELEIKKMASPDFVVVCMRPSTVFGAGSYLRSDIVFNSMVGSAYTTGKIEIRNDGTPWRPVVHVRDVSSAFVAALEAPANLVQGESFNVGIPNGNFTILQLAQAAEKVVPGSKIVFTGNNSKDERTYRVSFHKILTVLKDFFKPEWDLSRGGAELVDLYKKIGFTEEHYRGPLTNRLKKIRALREEGRIDEKLRFGTAVVNNIFDYDLCVIGGAGHVGLPLGVVFADSGVKTVLLDINTEALSEIRSGKFPFTEKGGDEALRSALEKKNLFTSESADVIAKSRCVVIIIGTPVDEYLSPDFAGILGLIDRYIQFFRDGQVVILRSTVYPGTTEKIQNYFVARGKNVKLAFCPERIMQGQAIEELQKWPQIISAFDDATIQEVTKLFRRITPAKLIATKPIEAELAKLFTNSWRYIRFAVANQFFMIAHDHNLDYSAIYKAMKEDYPRNNDLPSPGFSAGPCLLKDTMQLAAFTNNNFWIGHAAMLVNEGVVNHLMAHLRRNFFDSLKEKTIGILGMAFKADIDDPRDSLSYKLRKMAMVECKQVLCTDPYIADARFVSLEKTLTDSDILILATPHAEYLNIPYDKYPNKTFVNIWNAHEAFQSKEEPVVNKSKITKKILVTGAAGFVGYHLVRHLIHHADQDTQIVLVDNLTRGQLGRDFEEILSDSRVTFLRLDLTDLQAYKELGSGYKEVYHLAAVNGTRAFYEKPHEVLRVNTLSIVYMLEWFRKECRGGKFCFTSSNEAYAGGLSAFQMLPIPTPENIPLVVEDPYNPRWSYGGTKLIGELFVIHYAQMYHFSAFIVRPHNLYGPRAGFDHVIPEFLMRITDRIDPFPINGGDDTRSFCYIEDAVEAIRMLMESDKTSGGKVETVHIGSHNEIMIKDLAEKMFELVKWRPQSLQIKSSPIGSVKRRRADIGKVKEMVGWEPRTSIEVGLMKTHEWYEKNGPPKVSLPVPDAAGQRTKTTLV